MLFDTLPRHRELPHLRVWLDEELCVDPLQRDDSLKSPFRSFLRTDASDSPSAFPEALNRTTNSWPRQATPASSWPGKGRTDMTKTTLTSDGRIISIPSRCTASFAAILSTRAPSRYPFIRLHRTCSTPPTMQATVCARRRSATSIHRINNPTTDVLSRRLQPNSKAGSAPCRCEPDRPPWCPGYSPSPSWSASTTSIGGLIYLMRLLAHTFPDFGIESKPPRWTSRKIGKR